MSLLFVYLFLALTVSFICSIAEAVLLSTPLSFLHSKAEQQDPKAKALIHMKKDIDKPLSAILALNTIAHTVGAAGVGAQATAVFGEAYFGVISAVLTLCILVLTEIIPKTLGANYYKTLYAPTATAISSMVVLCYPLVLLASFLTRRLSKKQQESSISREELSSLVKIGEQEGIFNGKETKIIQNLIKLKDVAVSTIHTPRIMMIQADENTKLFEFLSKKELLHFSRIPIYSEQSENVVGYVLRDTIFEHLAADEFDIPLKEFKRNILQFNERMSVVEAWSKLTEKHEHIAIITNEYGEVQGLLTLEDILETLLGFEIIDEKDKIVDLRQYAEDRWKSKQRKYQFIENNRGE
ncbi:CNNM domain-containing protein [Myroides sp. C15-4]|uniref:CNNM domain-containing protein n=1 Tax=Myroides sp. C15-4 TaxID=3400532 RepID=UPI003D2F8F69